MSRSRLLRCAAAGLALALAAPAAAEPPSRTRGSAPGIRLPESSIRLLLRNRDALGLDGGQVLTLELKDAELQRRTEAVLADVAARPERDRGPASLDDRGGPRGGGMGPPAGGMSPPGGVGGRGEGGAGGRRGEPGDRGRERRGDGAPPADDERTRRALDDVEAMDRAAVEGVRRIFTERQRPKIDALLARRAELLPRAAPAAAPPRPPSAAPGSRPASP